MQTHLLNKVRLPKNTFNSILNSYCGVITYSDKLGGLTRRYYSFMATERSISIYYTDLLIALNPSLRPLLPRPVRLFSNIRSHSTNIPSEAPLSKDGIKVTCELVNQTVANQGVAITEDRLNELLKIDTVSFPFKLDDAAYLAYTALVGKPKTRNPRTGVYILTYKKTGQRYVGSSNGLSRRLQQYRDPNSIQKETGLLVPLIRKHGLDAFRIDIIVIPSHLEDNYSYMFLEQYHLLTEEFELNTQKYVNFRVNQGKRVYIYDKDKKVLYFQEISYNNVRNKLSIHVATISKFMNKDDLYLGTFAITNYLLAGAEKSDLTLEGFNNLLDEKRALASSVTMKARMGKPVWLRHEKSGDINKFDTRSEAYEYLRKRGHRLDSGVINSKLDSGTVYKDHY